MQGQGGDGYGAGVDAGLVGAHGGVALGCVVAGAVVAQGGLDHAGLPEGGADAFQRRRRDVPLGRRPAPPLLNEGEVVVGHGFLSEGHLEVVGMPGALQVLKVAAQFPVHLAGGDGHQAADFFRGQDGGADHGAGAPVVADQAGPFRAQGIDQGHGVPGQQGRVVASVGRGGGGRIAAHKGGHGAEAGRRQVGQQVAEGPGVVGEAVQADGQGAFAHFQVVEVDAVGVDAAGGEVGHRIHYPFIRDP